MAAVTPAENVPPDAGALSESLRDFGYTLPHALADLIDNSITAGASQVDITVETTGPSPVISVIDNGKGMSESQLVEAMRLGTRGPLLPRAAADLGRFGLGMKTASISQGRSLTVVTKCESKRHIRCWDLDHVSRAGWQLLQSASTAAEAASSRLKASKSGTAVVIEKLDRVKIDGDSEQAGQHQLATALKHIRSHLAMVFHHFIDRGLAITLGGSRIAAWDPFLTSKSTRLPEETITYLGEHIDVQPFVLPHHSRLSDDEHAAAAGPHGWNGHQGFYIYRNNRLVVPGTWLNLGVKKEEHFKLARIRVDLPNSIDHDWHLNVMKSHVSVPPTLRATFHRIAQDVRRQASEVYRYRGERELPDKSPPERYVWKRKNSGRGVRFVIDRTHPLVQSLLQAGCAHDELLGQVLSLVETTVPISTIIAEPARSLDGAPVAVDDATLKTFVEMAHHAEQFLVRHGLSPIDARQKILNSEPFAAHRKQILEHISQGV